MKKFIYRVSAVILVTFLSLANLGATGSYVAAISTACVLSLVAWWVSIKIDTKNKSTLQQPLTDKEIEAMCPHFEDPIRREMWIIGFKAANGITKE